MADIKHDYRLKIIKEQSGRPYVTYIVRERGRVSYIATDETTLALANLIHDDAAAARFALTDAPSGEDAAIALRAILSHQHRNHTPSVPKVEVLS